MIRKRRVDPKHLDSWLSETIYGAVGGKYVLRLLEGGAPSEIFDQLAGYLHEAHDDARQRLRSALSPTLAPYADPLADPAFGYPGDLHTSTLMGYFGEILGGLIAEHKPLHGKSQWQIPAFPFRFHQVAFQSLDVRRDLLQQGIAAPAPDAEGATIPGRTGNDVLAFLLGSKGNLSAVLVCEAKCYSAHNAQKAKQAHSQVGSHSQTRCPSGIRELIELLDDYETPEAVEWCDRLRAWYLDPKIRIARFNLLSYATGNRPRRPATRTTWLAATKPDPAYTATDPLEVVEIHLDDPDELVRNLYRGGK